MVEFDSLWVHYYCPVVQLVEHSTVNRVVSGSSPGRTANGDLEPKQTRSLLED